MAEYMVRGKWQKCLIAADRQYNTKGMSQIIEGYVCDACNNFSVSMYRYCPNCGADMRGKADV